MILIVPLSEIIGAHLEGFVRMPWGASGQDFSAGKYSINFSHFYICKKGDNFYKVLEEARCSTVAQTWPLPHLPSIRYVTPDELFLAISVPPPVKRGHSEILPKGS